MAAAGKPRKAKKQPTASQRRQAAPVEPVAQEPFVLDTADCYSSISEEKQKLCIEVANDLELRQKKLSQETRWLAFALKAVVCSILHTREIFDKDMFTDVPLKKSINPKNGSGETKTIRIKMMKKNHPANIQIMKVLHDLTKPMEAKKLEGVDFGVVVDPKDPQSVVYEIYRFQFHYDSVQPNFSIRSQNNKELARCAYSSQEDIGFAISATLRSLGKVLSKLEKIEYETALSTHARVSDNFPLNRKRFHHNLPNDDYAFVNYQGRLPKKLRMEGYQDRASGMDCRIESVLVKDEFTQFNTTALEQTVCTEVEPEPEVPRGQEVVEDPNLSGIAQNVEEMHIHEDVGVSTPIRTSIYGLSVPGSAEQIVMDVTSPASLMAVKTPSISPASTRVH